MVAQTLYDDLEVGQGCAKPDIWKNDLKVQLCRPLRDTMSLNPRLESGLSSPV